MKFEFLNPVYESNLISEKGFNCIVGIDEVGRGSWAGPVAVGAYIYTKKCQLVEGIQDSKLIKLSKREECYKNFKEEDYLVKFGEVEVIDSIGIGKTIEKLIVDIISEVRNSYRKPFFIIDGQFTVNFGNDSIKRIKADSTYYSVAAASILAKVERDRLMKKLHLSYPNYGFDTNVGYPTKKHIEGLNKFGVTILHRKSYEPIRMILEI
jgi:ribonuclease HII